MKEFIINLYRNPQFPLYAGIAIAILASLFIIVVLIAKKDKKKMDETKALQLETIQKQNDADMTIAYNPAIPPEVPASDIGEEQTPVQPAPADAPAFMSAPSVPNEIKQNPVTENVPVINPEDIPDTPKEEMPGYNNTPAVPKSFVMEPNIQPVIPTDTIENIRNINQAIEKDLNDLEKVNNVSVPNVAPVEVLSDTLDATPAPAPARPQVFSAVNPPKNNNENNN